MLIIDGRLDLAWNALQGNRDLACSAHTLRIQERTPGPGRGLGAVALSEPQPGHVGLCFATLFARCTRQSVARNWLRRLHTAWAPPEAQN
jgi:hypothetical protein